MSLKQWYKPAAIAALSSGALWATWIGNASAVAVDTRKCNLSPVIWRSTLNIYRNSCSISSTSAISAYWNGSGRWQQHSNIIDGFFVNDPSDCSYDTDDGQNEVARVPPAQIDGFAGKTICQLGACVFGLSNSIDQCDILISDTTTFNDTDGAALSNDGRRAFVHEFGHLLGFLHSNDRQSVMHFQSGPRAGSSDIGTTWPADTIALSSFYGLTTTTANLVPSAQEVVGGGCAGPGNCVQTMNLPGNVTVCRGGSVSGVRFYRGNTGGTTVSSYQFRLRLSTTPPPSGYSQTSNVVAIFSDGLFQFDGGPVMLNFTVPTTLANGTYRLYMDLDFANSIGEVRNDDNTTVSINQFIVNC